MVEFPFDLSIIWLSFFLSTLLIIALACRYNYLPSIEWQGKKKKLHGSSIKIIEPTSFFIERVHIVFRKIPTKESRSYSLDEYQQFSFSSIVYFYNLEEDIFNGVKQPIAHIIMS